MNPRDLAQANDASPLGALPLDEPMPEHFRPLGHDYALIERIGEGGMGEVWRARQLSTGREVAVKLLRHSRPDDRFAQEVSALAKVQHPGIVRLFQAGQYEGRPFLVMELITGPTLADRLKQERLNPRIAAQLLREAAEAISAAHAQGIVHRDLKPSNLLLDGSAKVRVTDFGLAKDLDSDRQLTVTGEQLGTPAYMAPEQIDPRCGEIGPVTDVYELGATLYHAVTGAQPFAGNSTAETLHRVSTGEPDWKTPWKGIQRDLLIICQKAMRREPGRRYASARDFAADLENFLGGKPIKARPATLGERAWRLARQPGSVAVVVCVALAVFLFPVWRSLSARSQISELLPDWPTTPPQVYNKLVMQVPQKPGRLAAFSDVRGLFVTGVGNGAVRQVELDPWKIVANSLSRSAGDAEFMQFLPGTDHLLVVERPGSWKLWTVGHERKVIVAGDSHERNHLVALTGR